MITVLTLIFFIFGLIIGSFLNVVIARLNTERSFGGRSACMSCRTTLRFYELVPVFSFLAQGGRCRTCKIRISIIYPVVETLTGFIFALIFLKFQDLFFINTLVFSATYAYYAAAFSLLLVIAVYDLRHKIIPDSLSFIFGLMAFIGLFFFNNYAFAPHIPNLLQLSAGFVVSLPLAFFWFVSSGRWMGLGDAKLAVGMGWLLGCSRVLSGAVMAFWIGAVVGITLVLFSGKHGMKSELPFAPYLVFGALLAFIFGLTFFPLF